MKYLGLDVGTKRTGVAFADSDDDILISLATIEHASQEELLESVCLLVKERNIDEVIVGLPLLLSGKEGSQAEIVQNFAQKLSQAKIPCSFIDERYTTPKSAQFDPDSAAACAILSIILDRE